MKQGRNAISSAAVFRQSLSKPERKSNTAAAARKIPKRSSGLPAEIRSCAALFNLSRNFFTPSNPVSFTVLRRYMPPVSAAIFCKRASSRRLPATSPERECITPPLSPGTGAAMSGEPKPIAATGIFSLPRSAALFSASPSS